MKETNESKTFRALKRNSIEDMIELYQDARVPYSPDVYVGSGSSYGGHVVGVGNITINTSDLRPRELILHHIRIKLLEENGWTFDEFIMAIEKRAIVYEVKMHNNSIQFPSELLNRARQFFPNLKYTEAKLELE